MANVSALETLRKEHADSPGVADSGADATLAVEAVRPEQNLALEDWKALRAA